MQISIDFSVVIILITVVISVEEIFIYLMIKFTKGNYEIFLFK